MMEWSPNRRLQLRMVVSLLGLGLPVFAASIASGVAVALGIGFITLFTPMPLEFGTPVANGLVGVATVAVLAAVVWGERDAPSYVIDATGARPATADEYPTLQATVRSVSHQVDAPIPDIYVTPIEQPLSLTTGFSPQDACLLVSEGLLDLLDDAELEAVVAHEVAHTKNRDAAVMTAVALPIAAAGRVGSLLAGPTAGVEHGSVSRADYADALLTVGLVVALPVGICTLLLSASLSRAREFAADRGAVAITGKPAALATALRTIETAVGERSATTVPRAEIGAFTIVALDVESDGAFATLYQRFDRIVATHPDLETRVTRLQELMDSQERY
ncbi:heat shock protein HtpX [Halopenitus persicus]|uniref:Heat shock protein HtpX n=2 Tax=Halopenitus persicus TaxID=1048396 RepID=A0A1H3P009_9EURY|nr:heat shock protein HtpX [Halopenitus persicus]